jgi:hypothetical protein
VRRSRGFMTRRHGVVTARSSVSSTAVQSEEGGGSSGRQDGQDMTDEVYLFWVPAVELVECSHHMA